MLDQWGFKQSNPVRTGSLSLVLDVSPEIHIYICSRLRMSPSLGACGSLLSSLSQWQKHGRQIPISVFLCEGSRVLNLILVLPSLAIVMAPNAHLTCAVAESPRKFYRRLFPKTRRDRPRDAAGGAATCQQALTRTI